MKSKKLPIATRGSSHGMFAPVQSAINAATEFLKYSPEGAKYLVDSFTKSVTRFGKSLAESAKSMRAKLVEFSEYVWIENAANGEEWQGKMPKRGNQNFQTHIADTAADDIKQFIKNPIKIDFAISTSAAYIRGFTDAGTKLVDEAAKLLDKLINGFFAEMGWINKDSTLYEVTDKGQVKTIDGKEQKVNAEEAKAKIEQRLPTYLNEKGIQVVAVISHPHPADKAEQPQAVAGTRESQPDDKAEKKKTPPSQGYSTR